MRTGAARSWMIGVVAVVAAMASTQSLCAAVPSPKLRITDLKQLPTPLPIPYDTKRTPIQVNAEVDAAFARAKASHKRVIIDLGGNWCSWCRLLAATMVLPEVRPFLDAHFEIVSVNVSASGGHTDRNLEVVHRFGLKTIPGFPWLIVADADGKVLTSSYEITDDRHHTPQAMVDWLASWAVPAPP